MKGIIYKIECCITGEVYYGSTTKTLNQRMIQHKSKWKAWTAGKTRYITSFNIIERGHYSYSLIENVECDDKHQLHTRERFYIENNECINKMIPNRSDKEYYIDNKDKYKAYNIENKQRIKERKKKKVIYVGKS